MVDDASYTTNPLATRMSFAQLDHGVLTTRLHEFVRMIPKRIVLLEAEVRSSGCAGCMLDWSPESFGPLGLWLAQHVTTKRRTLEEIAAIKQALKLPVPVSEVDISDRTLSLVYDVAMYFGASLAKEHRHLRWSVILKDKRNVEYGQPVLVGFPKNAPLNPVRIVSTVAWSVIRGTAKADNLSGAFTVWSELAYASSRVH